MISYIEMTAHACRSVHVAGVGWPEYVYKAPKKQWERKPRQRNLDESKRAILAVLANGENTALGINSILGLPNGSLYRCLTDLATDRIIAHHDTRSRRNNSIRVYFAVADKCLH
jgi:hypothetical protein